MEKNQKDSPYPIRDQFNAEVEAMLSINEPKKFTMRQIAEAAVEIIGEYEHGSAEVGDVSPGMTLPAYKEGLMDFLLSLPFYEGD
jgi:hypothetical protein